MKTKTIVCAMITAALLAGGLTACVSEKQDEAQLKAQAKVSRTEAEKIALAKVPDGTIKEGEIEKEKGKLIWSFDIATPGTKDITEVNVDALSGEIVGVEHESQAQQEKETKKEKD
jgi:uncharacterized membrane protein YkoI